ncbi:MAG TPA: hypothetical protein VMZ90_06850 [Vicinamibacterales bacterium]|nr:hypothetical protein [Vicinamibacterales bacterium]
MKQSLSALAVALILTGGVQLAAQQQAPPTPAQAPAQAAVAKSAGPAGKWVLNLEGPQGAMSINLDVKVDAANKVTGTLEGPSGPAEIAGEVKDGVLGFTFGFDAGGTPMQIAVEAKVDAQDKLTGTMAVGDMGKFPFTGTRAKGL